MKHAERRIMSAAFFLGIALWVVDSAIDAIYFSHQPFIDLLILDIPPHEIYMRLFGFLAILVFGGLAVLGVRRIGSVERKTEHLNGILKAIRDINQIITRERTAEPLLRETCEILAASGSYRFAAIVLAGGGDAPPFATEAGLGDRYNRMRALLDGGIVPECYRSSTRDPDMKIIRSPGEAGCPIAEAFEGGMCINIRIQHDGIVFGLLALGSVSADIDPDEQSLLHEIAGDLGFALSAIANEEKRATAEHALRRNEAHYRAIFEQSRDAINIIDFDGAILGVNDAWLELFGYARAETIEMNIMSLYENPDDIERINAEVLEHDFARDIEVRLKRRDGSAIIGLVTKSVFRGPDGTVEGFLSITRDITDRIRAGEMLLRYRWAIESSPDLTSAIDRSYRYIFTNEAFLRYRGYTRDQVEGRTVAEVLGEPLFRDVIKPTFDRALDGEEIRFEFEGEYTMGRRITEVAYLPLRNAKGEIEGILATSRDITERKNHEREIEDIARFPLENPDPVYRVVADGTLLFSNPAGTELLAEWESRVGGVAPGFLLDAVREALSDGKAKNVEFGEKQIFNVWVVPFAGSGYANVYMRDITAEKHLQAQYFQSQKMESVARLAGGIAHDFNNIITAIIGYADLAAATLSPDNPVREDIFEIGRSAHRAADLTRHLLAFSRRQIIAPRILNLNTALASMDRMFRRLIGEDIELVTLQEPRLWSVRVDPGQIEQVLTNLAVNARDAMPGGGKLTIETANVHLDEHYAADHAEVIPGDHVMVAVSDTGCGMTDEVKVHVFEPFFTTKEQGKGTGLGLATIHGIVKQSNGHVWIYSEPGRGTAVKIYFPRVAEPPEDFAAERDEPLRGGSEVILVVEDEPAVLRMTVRILREAGYEVLEASNGEEAIRTASEYEHTIHLIITDVVMPRLGGKELGERMKILRPDTKILFVSGYTDNSIVHHGVLEPGVQFLQKPYTAVRLARKVRDVLEGRNDLFD